MYYFFFYTMDSKTAIKKGKQFKNS